MTSRACEERRAAERILRAARGRILKTVHIYLLLTTVHASRGGTVLPHAVFVRAWSE